MSTPEPPDGRTPGPSDRPGSSAGGSGPDPAGEQPTRELSAGSHPAAGSPESGATHDSGATHGSPSGTPEAAHAAPAAVGGAAGAGAAAPPPRRRGRWSPGGWTPRRRWFTGAAALLVLLVIVGAVIGIARHEHHGRWGDRHGGGPHRSAFQDGPRGRGPGGEWGERGGPGGWGGGPGGMGPDAMGGGWGGPRGAMANTAAVTGSVVSVTGDSLVVAADGGAQTTIPTTANTRVRGAGNGLTGLRPGQRVVVRVGGDRTAVAVLVPRARAFGTVTALNGPKATLVRADGMTEVVDVTVANPQPKVGDQLVASGTPADNGATLKADTVRILPKAG